MSYISIPRAVVNPAQLDDVLRSALGDAYTGISHCDDVLCVFFAGSPTPQQRDTTRQLVVDHDPQQLTLRQQHEKDRDAGPFFRLSRDALAAHVSTMDEAAFRKVMVRAFADLRDMVRGAS